MNRTRLLSLISFFLFSSIFFADAGGHGSDINLDPTVACENKSHDESCEFYNHDEDKYRGICRVVIEDLTCVRNQPIEYASHESNAHDTNSKNKSIDDETEHHSH